MRVIFSVFIPLIALVFSFSAPGFSAQMGKYKYSDFKKPITCAGCHKEIYQEWQQSMMSKSYTHIWDEVEYFKLALPHSQKEPKVAGVKAGCIGCHSPLAFLTGDIPPKPVSANSRANEGVSCEVCHSITGSTEEEPFNFSFIVEPGRDKQGPRKDAKSPFHGVVYSEFLKSPKFCATCHDEQSPYGAWVKETYREWKAGPYAKEGVRCQDCHMYRAPGKPAIGGKERQDMAHHVFHGSHVPSKLAGVIDLALYVSKKELSPGSRLKIRAELFNGKAGHMVPSGSSEERMLWLEVWAIDAQGKKFHLPVDKKGFKGEEFTIADSSVRAYQAIGEIMEIKGFKGLKRDGDLPDGARIFRRPFFDPKGRMTICQWYTKENTLVDYRIGPRETKVETYTWRLPKDVAKGPLTIEATLYYSQVPSSVGKFFELPAEEYQPIVVNKAILKLEVK
ncbi:multiheme c-type cytochrome [Thermosulfuriphilus sp.]